MGSVGGGEGGWDVELVREMSVRKVVGGVSVHLPQRRHRHP